MDPESHSLLLPNHNPPHHTASSNNTMANTKAYSSSLSTNTTMYSSENSKMMVNHNHHLPASYLSTKLPRELAFCIMAFIVGVYSPATIFRPIFGMNIRPIPYQILANSKDVILDLGLNNPLVEDVTIPSNFLIQTSITVPLLILFFIAIIIAPKKQLKPYNYHDAHSSVCVLLTTIAMTEFTTQMAKFYVGRLRPNFYALCGFDVTTLSCTNSIDMQMEARSSFPSGHSSLSTAGMGVLVYFLLGRVAISAVTSTRANSSGDSISMTNKLYAYLALLPFAYSTFCACSRLVDNWHHPSDIIGGIVLGLFCSTFGYHLW